MPGRGGTVSSTTQFACLHDVLANAQDTSPSEGAAIQLKPSYAPGHAVQEGSAQ